MTRHIAALTLLLVWSVVSSGCTNSCKKGTALVSFTLDGSSATADSLQIEVAVGGQSRPSSLVLRSGTSSGSFEIDFANGYPASGQALTVSITALHGTDIVGDGMGTTTLASGCTSFAVRVDGTVVEAMDLSGQTGEMSNSTDMASTDLAAMACAPPTGNQSSQCPAAQPICGTDGSCRTCAQNSECTIGVCKSDGTCAAASEVAYVDNSNANCSNTAHVSTPSSPYCQIQPTIDAFGGFPYIRVAGSVTPYQPVTVGAETSPINVTLVGPAIFSGSAAAYIYDSAKIAVTIQTSAAQPVALTVDGILLQGGSSPAMNGVVCNQGSGSATLTLRNSQVKMSGLIGVSTSNCTLNIDRSTVINNAGGGIKMNGSPFVVTNNFIYNNGTLGSSTIAVEIDSGSSGTFAFNTVANNASGAATIGGILCPSAGAVIPILDSIVFGNTQDTGSQIAGKCSLQNVVTGTDSFAGAIQMSPTLTSDKHLVANDAANMACCVDKVTNPMTPNADHDGDLSHRPKGAAWDIGAHEVQ
jgi:hypothetical protein